MLLKLFSPVAAVAVVQLFSSKLCKDVPYRNVCLSVLVCNLQPSYSSHRQRAPSHLTIRKFSFFSTKFSFSFSCLINDSSKSDAYDGVLSMPLPTVR